MPLTTYYLEMRDPQWFHVKRGPSRFATRRVLPSDPIVNQRFYRSVGKPWQWTDRLVWTEKQWRTYAVRDELETWIGYLDDDEIGYFELEAQPECNVQLQYFGLLPEFTGRGLGGALLSSAIARAWAMEGTRRVWVHTCTNDHPAALENYRRRGFQIYRTEVE